MRKQYFILRERLGRWNTNLKNLEDKIYDYMKNYRTDRENILKKIEEQKKSKENKNED